MGTPVGPHHFLTAHHFGGSIGDKFYYGGEVFTTIGSVDDAGSDLRLWEVSERFPSYAPLYSSTDEAGKGLVVFGRGLDRGVVVTNTIQVRDRGQWVTAAMTNGWQWGAYNYTQRWGTNEVSTVTTVNGFPVLKVDWDAGAGDEECMLADKDSGGGVFIQDNGVWKLAGINWLVGPATSYSFNSDGSAPFNATILDFSGDSPLYIENGGSWVDTDSLGITKSSFYSSRISSRYSWITNNVTDFDQDVDLLPDWWEQQYTGSTTNMIASADPDEDNLSNLDEYLNGSNPENPDTDNDTMDDGWEVFNGLCPTNAVDGGATDTDTDGLVNTNEYVLGTDPQDTDTDDDWMPDGWEFDNGLDPTNAVDGGLDFDNDTLVNSNEYLLGTDLTNPDMDGDAVLDGWEFFGTSNTAYGSEATIITNADSDDDGLPDGVEMGITNSNGFITNPNSADTDHDDIPDEWEVVNGINPIDDSDGTVDTDLDGFVNSDEWIADTSPSNENSFLKIESFVLSTNQTVLFLGSTNRQYRLIYTTNDLAATNLVWITNGIPIMGEGSNTSISATNTEESVFYRLQVELP